MSTILVVDDSVTDQQVISGSLQREGYTVLTVSNEQDALQKIHQQTPDLIVLDVVLPDRSGFEICRDLKEAETTKHIPIVLCSSKGSNMDKFWGKQQGADAYVTKPVDATELLQAIRQFA
jgi:chemotaxis family two-component system response regulator PixH